MEYFTPAVNVLLVSWSVLLSQMAGEISCLLELLIASVSSQVIGLLFSYLVPEVRLEIVFCPGQQPTVILIKG